MSAAKDPRSLLKLEMDATDSRGASLNDLLAFISEVERVAPDLMDAKIWSASFGTDFKVLASLQVRGPVPDHAPAVQQAPRPELEVLAENEQLHGRLGRIRQHLDDYDNDGLGDQRLHDRIRYDLDDWVPFEPGVSTELRDAFTRLCRRWVAGELEAVHAMRSICIGLCVDLHPETKSVPDEDND